MKALWFTNTSSLYEKENHHYYGGGWIESLEELITEQTDIELGISFFHPTDKEKKKKDKVTYYPILKKQKKNIEKFILNWSCRIETDQHVENFLSIIEDFKPDVIQIFGTENTFAKILPHTNVPVIIHLQGIISPYANAFYPPGINGYNIFLAPVFLRNNILGNSLLFDKKRFEKQAKRELSYFKNSKYLMGRTSWDKSVSKLLAPQSDYFHVDEVIRSVFYDTPEWVPNEQKKIVIVSTISKTIYKGFDLILKTAGLLKKHSNLTFEWQIAGLNRHDPLIKFFEKSLGLKCESCNIIVKGTKNSSELIETLKAADIFVHPSYIDNSPNSVCEAQLLGVPVIACNVGGVSTIIENEVSGILVPANAPYELAAQIIKVTTDKTKSKSLGKHGRNAAMQRHNRNTILKDIINCYTKIINR